MAKVLAVDDSISIRQMVSHTLQDAGYEVETAADGREALAKAQKARFDVIISDVNMPVMTGFEFVKAVRMQSQYKFTPILMLTTETSPEKKTRGQSSRCNRMASQTLQPRNPAKNFAARFVKS